MRLIHIFCNLIPDLFAGNTNVTTDVGMSKEMRKYYSDYLIDLAEPLLVHQQFGQKHDIPKNGGKTINFRKYSPLPKMLTPLTEGVTPDGQKLTVTDIEATVQQYGGYVELSDVLLLTAVDNNLVEAIQLLASQAGRTLDTISREILNAGTNVQYGNAVKTARYNLVGGETTGNDYLTVDAIKKAVRTLKASNAPKINGYYVGIINQDITYDLTNDNDWKYPHQYVDTENIYNGEIGSIAGVRFVETSEAKIFKGANLTAANRDLTVASLSTKTITVDEAISAAEATALVGRKIIVTHSTTSEQYTVASCASGAAGAATITVKESPTLVTPADGDKVYPGEGGAKGRAVYSTLILGNNAYGVTNITGGGLEHIVKQLGSAGTADPLNQRATAGWKAIQVTVRLVEDYMTRIETCSTFDADAN